MPETTHLISKDEPTKGYGGVANPEGGLSSRDVLELQQVYGLNALDAQDKTSFLSILLSQLMNLIFLLTSIAALITHLTGDQVKTTFLVTLVCVVCVLNAIGEYTGQDASAALKAMNKDVARVRRDGQELEVDAEQVVPGDIVLLRIGDMVPADMEVVTCLDLQTNEAILTGEPAEINKTLEPKETDSQFPSNMLYKSTSVVAGEGVGLVTAIGMRTQVGLIAKRLADPKNDSIAKNVPPLQRSINILGTYIGAACICVICVGSAASMLLRYQSLPAACAANDTDCLIYASLVRGLLMAVSIIPHGLPLVLMIMLRVASQRMAENNAVVTRQSAVDYLGAANYICTDKTGTLTEGKMAATVLVGVCRDAASGTCGPVDVGFYPIRGLNPAGAPYPAKDLTPEVCGKIDRGSIPSSLGLHNLNDVHANVSEVVAPAAVARASLAAAYLNAHDPVIAQKEDGSWVSKGNMSDAALKVAAMKGGYGESSPLSLELRQRHFREAQLEVPFNSKRKMSATVHRILGGGACLSSLHFDADTAYYAIVKGAPDQLLPKLTAVLELCEESLVLSKQQMTQQDRDLVDARNHELSRQALRTLMMAIRPLSAGDLEKLRSSSSADERLELLLESPLALLGLWGIYDPPRATVPPSVLECHRAGIEVVMITGDQPSTALAIGRKVGITEPPAFSQRSVPTKDHDLCMHCSELHHEKPHIVRELSRDRVLSQSSRTLRVHDAKVDADDHEKEYKDDKDIETLTQRVRMWARAQPSDKVCIVDSLCQQHQITAMTGDGVNDAPALKGADIGVAMGISGTAVTRNAADLILMDDNFSSIVAAVREGRKIYGNVQKYVLFNLSVKASECLCLLVAIFGGFCMPVQGLQQLCNLVLTHIIPPMSLAFENAEWYSMLVPPRNTQTDLVLNQTLLVYRWFPFIVCYAVVVMTNLCFGVYMHTGFVTVHALMGSTLAGAVQAEEAACEIAGHMVSGVFLQDAAPYHCRCRVRETPWSARHNAKVVEQWGIKDADAVHVDRWTGDDAGAFDLRASPFHDAVDKLLESCVDREGVEHMCWADQEAERPLLGTRNNCAAYGAQLGSTMGYVSVQVGEILALTTFRTDAPFWEAPVSRAYLGMLVFNLCGLAVLLYVPAVSEILDLSPLSPLRLGMSLLAPLCLLALAEAIKAFYNLKLNSDLASRYGISQKMALALPGDVEAPQAV